MDIHQIKHNAYNSNNINNAHKNLACNHSALDVHNNYNNYTIDNKKYHSYDKEYKEVDIADDDHINLMRLSNNINLVNSQNFEQR